METRAHYVAVGAFVVAMVFLGFVAALYFGGVELTTRFARYDVFFRGPVSGLSKGANVEYNGIPVGKVFEVRIAPQDVELIRVTLEIDNTIVIKEDAKAQVESNILSGVAYILISKGTQEAAVLTAKEGQRYPVIQARRSALASVYARGPALLDQLARIGDHLEELLNEHNRVAVSDSLDNIRSLTAKLAAHDQEITELTGNANQALKALTTLLTNVDQSYSTPDGIKDRLAQSLSSIDKAAIGLGDTGKEMRLAVHEARPAVREFGARTIRDFDDLLREARQLMIGLTRLAERIERDPSRLLYGDRREGYRPK